VSLILGIDPGFASVGFALVQLEKAGTMRLLDIGVVRTQKSQKKQNTLASEDNVRRAREIAAWLEAYVQGLAPGWPSLGRQVSAVCAESMSFPRQASVAAKMALSWGILAAVLEQHQLPLVQSSPQAVKKYLCGANSLSKKKVQILVQRVFPLPVLLKAGLDKVPMSQREHPIDALAVVLACQRSDVINALRPR
jgi:Holliday junction resolvasome RuvABC endonuclease subunit